VACGPAEPAQPSTAGTSGSGATVAGTGGTAGGAQAGNGGASGSGGTVAPGGSGGSAGSESGGAGSGGAAGASAGAGSGGGGSGGASGSGGSGGLIPLEPCSEPSVSRLKVWEMQVVGGTQVPASGSPLRELQGGGGHELYVEWTLDGGGSYGTANAPLNNQGQYANGADPAENGVDISAAGGITLEYATTGPAYLQLRTASVPHGGDHFRADLPLTSGEIAIATLNFEDFRRPGGNTPPETAILQEVFSFTFVGGGTTNLTLRQVLVPGFSPPCE